MTQNAALLNHFSWWNNKLSLSFLWDEVFDDNVEGLDLISTRKVSRFTFSYANDAMTLVIVQT